MADKKYDKLVTFKIEDKKLADFKIKLKYEQLGQSEFIRNMIYLFIEDDERVMSVVKDLRNERGKEKLTTKRVIENIEKENSEKEKINDDYGITDYDIEALYDMFEKQEE